MKLIKENTKQSGITLIALVVTIVVLLILAGITINMLFSENGIITKAREAADKTAKAEENDIKGMQNVAGEIDEILNNGNGTKIEQIKILYQIQDIDAGSKAVILNYEKANVTIEDLEQLAAEIEGCSSFEEFLTVNGMKKDDFKKEIEETTGLSYEEGLKKSIENLRN